VLRTALAQRSRIGEHRGHIDLLALTCDGRPIVVELKRQGSSERPLRTTVEGLANPGGWADATGA
jgi:hypothetical protein